MKRVGVVGALGYTGRECVRLMLSHPNVELVGVYGSGRTLGRYSDHVPALAGQCDMDIASAEVERLCDDGCEVVFLAGPHAMSHELAPDLVDAGVVVFDISGAFRLHDPGAYMRWYGFAHDHSALLGERMYGLAEWMGPAIEGARLVALPGCYPTSVLLGTLPLSGAGLVDDSFRVIVDSISGISGAGRASARNAFCEVSVRPYGIEGHRHVPEMIEHGGLEGLIFTAQVGPFKRGILSTIHMRLHGWVTRNDVSVAYSGAYEQAPFVRLCPNGVAPEVGAVAGTNFCDIGWHLDEQTGHLRVFSAIDNLMKGASGQGVQCMNRRFGWAEEAGLNTSSLGVMV